MRTSSIAAAMLLCTVVLGSFFVLRNYGPESTVRRFHFATIKGDRRALREICTGTDASILALASKLKLVFDDHAQIGLGRVNDDDPNKVVAQFIYRTRSYVYTINWVLVHKREGWKISPEETLGGPMRQQVQQYRSP